MRVEVPGPLDRLKRRLHLATRAASVRLDRARGKRIVHFLHIGKTGGTAVRDALLGVKDPRYRLYFWGHHGTLANVPVGDSCFFFVRDPTTRFVSGFYSRQREGRPRYFSPWQPDERIAFERFKTANELALALSSEDPETKASAERAMGGIQHIKAGYGRWLGSQQYLKDRRDAILFVGSQEHLAEDFSRLTTLLGIHAELANDEVSSHRSPAHVDRKLDDQARLNLQRWYAEDYASLAVLRDWFPHLPEYDREAARTGNA
jgi:hypothetical protein